MALQESPRPSEEQGISGSKLGEVPCSERPVWFGTDMSSTSTLPEKALETLQKALKAGFRRFDTAYSYHVMCETKSVQDVPEEARIVRILDQAIEQSGVDRNEITVLYKVKPGIALESQLKLAGKWGTTILMLHELPDDPETFAREVAEAAGKRGWLLGVSNVGEVMLSVLFEYNLPIRYLQNRFTPYTRSQWDVLELCKKNEIKYLAYGLAGSAFEGTCDAKGGMPTELLSATLDEPLVKIAGDAGALRYLLCQWALALRIQPIIFTTTLARMMDYLVPRELPDPFVKTLTSFALCFPRSGLRSEWKLPGRLALLLDVVPSPFLARVLVVLLKAGLGPFLEQVAQDIGNDKLDYFGENLLRLCFDFQQDVTDANLWLDRLVQAVVAWSKSNNQETYTSVLAFARKVPHEHVNGGAQALCDAVLDGKYPPKKGTKRQLDQALTLISANPVTKEQVAKLNEIATEHEVGITANEGDPEILLYVDAERAQIMVKAIEAVTGPTTEG
ncbi:MAG TPA: aldo/keto reductase [Thermoanaerobaculia bacterium]|jgi:diketogulonate reductase-like aldo/keto reductase|nr:aldo/keto reductase [Thermoanaerobaculia bacterium]